MGQVQPSGAAQAKFVICNQTIEAGYKDTRRGGWQWHQTKMVDPGRAERLWLAIAVATFWAVSVGGEADATLPVSSLDALPATRVARRIASGRARPRMLSCFARGLVAILGALIRGTGWLFGRFYPEPWPLSAVGSTKKTTKCSVSAPRVETVSGKTC